MRDNPATADSNELSSPVESETGQQGVEGGAGVSGDIVERLRTDPGPSSCWSCGEWGCTNEAGQTVPVLCGCDDEDCGCAEQADNECSCDCHGWQETVRAAAEELERLRAELSDCENDFHALKEMFDRLRADRDRWQNIATVLVSAMKDPLDEQQQAAVGSAGRKRAMSDDIVTRLRNECQCSDDCRAVNDPCISMRAADEIERLRERMNILVDRNVELMTEADALKTVSNGQFGSTSETRWKRDD